MTAALPTATAELDRLRERMRRMEGGLARPELDALPGLSQAIRLRAGGSYQVDSASLALALMAGPSRGGAWCAVVGMADFGAEAAAELGVVLERTILVPEPGEAWLEATAALVDVTSLVLVRPPDRVSEAVAAKLSARLRKRGAALVSLGPWPRAEAAVSLAEPRWSGLGRGEGHLRSRRVVVEVRRGAAPPRRTALWFPAPEGALGLDTLTARPMDLRPADLRPADLRPADLQPADLPSVDVQEVG